MPVVIGHIAMSACPGGFLGVDVFFVISGYLICGGILRDLETGNFTLQGFYYRRVRRIMPAYFAVLVAVLLAGLLVFPWSRLVPLAHTSLFSIGFSTNLYFWLTTGYFQPNAHANPLLHLWSLGVEEHFYLLVPFLLMCLWRLRRSWMQSALFVATVLSFSLCVALGMAGESTTAFYLLPTRAWEMLAGALICRLPDAKGGGKSKWLSLLGLLMVVLPYWSITTENTLTNSGTSVEINPFGLASLGVTPFPGWVVLPTVIGTMLLIRYGSAGRVGSLLASKPFIGIGKISYSLYLWHWPVLVFARYLNYEQQPLALSALILVLSMLLAYLSWKWVENPVRKGAWFTPKVSLAFTLTGVGLLTAWCWMLIATEGLRLHIHKDANRHASAPRTFDSLLGNLKPKRAAFRPLEYPDVDENYVRILGDPEQIPSFCLLGDSHADSLSRGLDAAARSHGVAGYYIDRRLHAFYHPSTGAADFFEWVASRKEIKDVYLAGRWLFQERIRDGLPDLGDKGKVSELTLDPVIEQNIEKNFRTTAEWLKARGKRIFVFSTVPEYSYYPADMRARSMIIPFQLDLPIEITRQDYINRQRPFTRILRKLEAEGLLQYVPLGESFLRNEETVTMAPDGAPYYIDGDHLTREGAVMAAESLAPLLWQADKEN
jgi:peptidoglycan/LPS O-acetylase OafA/YrhL